MSSKKIRKADKKRKKQKQKLRKNNNVIRTKFEIEALDCCSSEFKEIVVSNLEHVLDNLDKHLEDHEAKVLRCWYLLGIMGRKLDKNPNFNFERADDYLKRIYYTFHNTFDSLWRRRAKISSLPDKSWERRANLLSDMLVPTAIKSLGETVYNKFSDSQRKTHFPKNMFQLFGDSSENKIVIEFTNTNSIPTDHGRLYFSKISPPRECIEKHAHQSEEFIPSNNVITVNRLSATLAFTSHAYHRIIQRVLVGDMPKSYYDMTLLHMVLSGKTFYRAVPSGKLDNNEFSLETYFACYAREVSRDIITYFLERGIEVEGNPILSDDSVKLIVRTGHCPLDFYRDEAKGSRYWVVKTFLVPGMRNTPEAKAYDGLDSSLVKKISNSLDEANINHIPFLVWLHQRGAPCFYKFTGDYDDPIGEAVEFSIDNIKEIKDPTILIDGYIE